MEKRAILAVVLSLTVWLLWSYFFSPKQPQIHDRKEPASVTQEARKKSVSAPERTIERKTYKSKTVDMKVAGRGKEQLIELDTGTYAATLSTKGASITKFTYKSRNTELIVGKNEFNARGHFDFSIHFSEEDFLEGNALDQSNWIVQKITDKEILFHTTIMLEGNPVRIEKKYLFLDNSDYFKISYSIKNLGRRDAVLPNGYVLVSPSDFLGPEMDFDNTYNQLYGIYYTNNDMEKVHKGGGFFSKNGVLKKANGPIEWVGVMSRYFLLIMVPEEFKGTGAISDNRKSTAFRTGLYIPADRLSPGKQLKKSFKVYVGEKDKERLAAVGSNLVDAVDVSKWIEPIRDFLLWSLLKINIIFGNFGWSLVLFSLISKIVLLPLTHKSTESMKKLQALNPQMNEIRDKYKDKPDVMNKKIMDLYKKNKVNPMSGCLPILVQMPFFFALYSALINSIDLWQAPFIFWIKDLSLPDTVFQIQNFNINILPIVMTLTTYLQQKMSSGDVVGQQQKMMMIMPLVLIVIFWNMPSGLVLYWIMQNVLQLLHQLYISKRGKNKSDA